MSRNLVSRKFLYLRALLIAFAAVFVLAQAQAQCKPPANQNPPLSPAEQASIELNGKNVTVYYCAPSLKGRKVGDQIAPYGKVWRTGANTATTLHTDANLRIGEQRVPAGTYTIYSLPSANGWQLIINKQTGQWGTVYKQDQDLGRVPMTAGSAPSAPVEKFEITFEDTHGNKTQLHLKWGDADVWVPVTAMK
ncbi:MAG TPA: DUF2911 domain-containing protein [Silvibacterium sp.]|nr:DUF2911 domain-containing protein [Silvibacterium sp.]